MNFGRHSCQAGDLLRSISCKALVLIVFLGMIASVPSESSAGIILHVDARADLSNAGRSEVRSPFSPPDVVFLPTGVILPSGVGRWVEFGDVIGTVKAGPGWPDVGPDGGSVGPGPTYGSNILSYNGVAGIVADRFLFLAGVFLSDDQPVDGLEPDRLDFRLIGTEFTSLSPLINQSFFIGDGRTSSGQTQTYQVPDGATRLYLGFLDSFLFGWPQGGDLPYAYWDNSGSIRAEFTVHSVPEPSTLLLTIAAGAALVFGRRRRNPTAMHHVRSTVGISPSKQ